MENIARPFQPVSWLSARTLYALVLAMLLLGAGFLAKPHHEGDIIEYASMATAIAHHGTPDIRREDVVAARELVVVPVPALAPHFDAMETNMQDPQRLHPVPGFQRTAGGTIYSIHFFTYSAFAAVALPVLEAFGLPLEYAFISVNLAAMFVLGLATLRLMGTPGRAAAAMLLFLACGGVLYWHWSSPEMFTAAGLLAGIALFTTGAPLRGGLLAGLAATQNPSLVAFAGFAPLFYVLANYQPGAGLRSALMMLMQPRIFLGAALCAALALTPPMISMINYGVPSLIAQYSTLPELIGLPRLASFFLDPNQGMIVAIPALAPVLALCGWRGAPAQRRRYAMLLACGLAFTLALALPALSAINWNSAAQGVMRYGFWAAMPLLFVFLLYLRTRQRWPLEAVALVLALQGLAMLHAMSYPTADFSPAAKWLLKNAPGWYNPDPELFAERVENREPALDPGKAFVYKPDGAPVKTLFNATGGGARVLCGEGSVPSNRTVRAGYGEWRYFDGPLRCTNSESMSAERLIGRGLLGPGWSALEKGGGEWDGVWSDGPSSRITLHPEGWLGSPQLVIKGQYFDGHSRTRVRINGQDFGWLPLDRAEAIEFTMEPGPHPSVVIELEHELPGGPAARGGDTRKIAFFLQRVELR